MLDFKDLSAYFILFGCSVVIVYFVNYIGRTAASIDSQGIKYFILTFANADERNEPMTSRILLNIFVPNVMMILLYIAFYNWQLNWIYRKIIWFVVFYFVFRFILICIILNRRELYAVKYELIIFIVSTLICRFVYIFYLHPSVMTSGIEKSVFISLSELREEIWFSIIVLTYTFTKEYLNKRVLSNKIIKDKNQNDYIKRMFLKFFHRYNKYTPVDYKHTYNVIFLYSVMILENYNRGKFTRMFERLKCRFHFPSTTGIMQNSKNKNVTDEKSINLFYEEYVTKGPTTMEWHLPYNYEKENNDINCVLEELALRQNNDESYLGSIDYIFRVILGIIKSDKDLKKKFCVPSYRDGLDDNSSDECFEEGSKDDYSFEFVTVSDLYELSYRIKDNTYISLDYHDFKPSGQVNCTKYVNSYVIKDDDISYNVIEISEVNNNFINCNNILMDSFNGENNIKLYFEECGSITIKGLNIKKHKDSIFSMVELGDCHNFTFINCQFFMNDCNFCFNDSEVYFSKCDFNGAVCSLFSGDFSRIIIDDSIIENSDFIEGDLVCLDNSELILNNVTFKNNTANLIINGKDSTMSGNNITFKNNTCSQGLYSVDSDVENIKIHHNNIKDGIY